MRARRALLGGDRLTVGDNGVGRGTGDPDKAPGNGLGTAIVKALVRQLEAQMETSSGSPSGLTVVISRATFQSRANLIA